MGYFLRFALISYASIVFFVVGLRLAVFRKLDLNFVKLVLIFISVAVPLSFSFYSEPLLHRILISLVWTSLLAFGFRFGRKISRTPPED